MTVILLRYVHHISRRTCTSQLCRRGGDSWLVRVIMISYAGHQKFVRGPLAYRSRKSLTEMPQGREGFSDREINRKMVFSMVKAVQCHNVPVFAQSGMFAGCCLVESGVCFMTPV